MAVHSSMVGTASALRARIEALKTEIKQEAERLPELARIAVDHGANIAYQRAIDQAAQQYVLTPAYVKKHLWLVPSSSKRFEARVTGTHRSTLIDRFKRPQNHTVAVKHPRRSKGNPRAGVARGRKLSGITTEVRRGNPVGWRSAFWIPLNRGRSSGGNGMALALRTGSGRGDFKVLHTVSVGQIWRRLRDEMQSDIEAIIEAEFSRLQSR